MAKTAVATKQKTQERQEPPQQVAPAYNPNLIRDIYLITSLGVTMLSGRDADEVREKIEQDKDHALDYRFYDDDGKRWAYWAQQDAEGTLKPPSFPDTDKYANTSLQLFTKAVVYPKLLALLLGILRKKAPTLWDKMLKPTTIIIAIVGIVFVMMLGLVALAG